MQQAIGQKLVEAGLTAEQVDLMDKGRFLFHDYGLNSRKCKKKIMKNLLTDIHFKTKPEFSVLENRKVFFSRIVHDGPLNSGYL